MLVKTQQWNKIRTQFSEDEKAELIKYTIGRAICPQGLIIDETAIDPELIVKLKYALGVVK